MRKEERKVMRRRGDLRKEEAGGRKCEEGGRRREGITVLLFYAHALARMKRSSLLFSLKEI